MNIYPFVTHRIVNWGDMDSLAHVNNAKYFSWFEDARIDLFEKLGMVSLAPSSTFGPILAYIDCQFIVPVTHPDEVLIGSWVSRIGNTSLQVDHVVHSQKYDSAVMASSKSIVVMINYQTSEKLRVPDDLRKTIKQSQEGFDIQRLKQSDN
ncbi:MAG: acyl-CoA thioesterase [Saprospiraceae bacterium]|nr:acyl-CoA thioesterase [Saprospiraceae bacterium]